MNKYREIFNSANSSLMKNETFAVATVTKSSGSTPGKVGNMMIIYKDGSILGTVGGGNLENNVIQGAVKCMDIGENQLLSYDLNDKGSLSMLCGGSTEVFIQVFKAEEELIIVGGGHIAEALYTVGKFLNFRVTVFEDREEFGNNKRFPEANVVFGEYGKTLNDYPINEKSYIVIVTRGHKYDEVSLKTVIDRGASYIGMIGSKNKVITSKNNLLNQGVTKEKLDGVYAPIGLNTGGTSPNEIAFSIMAEIMLVKNKGRLHHLRDAVV